MVITEYVYQNVTQGENNDHNEVSRINQTRHGKTCKKDNKKTKDNEIMIKQSIDQYPVMSIVEIIEQELKQQQRFLTPDDFDIQLKIAIEYHIKSWLIKSLGLESTGLTSGSYIQNTYEVHVPSMDFVDTSKMKDSNDLMFTEWIIPVIINDRQYTIENISGQDESFIVICEPYDGLITKKSLDFTDILTMQGD